jgi:GNAT superfamily N-acetyltransferase
MISLRPATSADWDRAWAIQEAAFRDLVTRTWGGWTAAQVRGCALAWNVARTLIIEDDGEMIGWLRRERSPSHDWLDLVVVAPEHQGRGVGTSILQRLIADARSRRVPLWLSVYQDNRARALYARLGFAEHPRDDLRVLMVWPADTIGSPDE